MDRDVTLPYAGTSIRYHNRSWITCSIPKAPTAVGAFRIGAHKCSLGHSKAPTQNTVKRPFKSSPTPRCRDYNCPPRKIGRSFGQSRPRHFGTGMGHLHQLQLHIIGCLPCCETPVLDGTETPEHSIGPACLPTARMVCKTIARVARHPCL